MRKEITEGIDLVYENGQLTIDAEIKGAKIQLSVNAASVLLPIIAQAKEDVASGKIDPIKGTTLDNKAIIEGLEILEDWVRK